MAAIRGNIALRKGIAVEDVNEDEVSRNLEWLVLMVARGDCAIVDARLVKEWTTDRREGGRKGQG